MSDHKWDKELKKAIREIFTLTVKLGGTISGEHGIGMFKKATWTSLFQKKQLNYKLKLKNYSIQIRS